MTARIILQSARPAFLLLTPICVLLGALTVHISVNALNEYHDFSSGLDLVTEVLHINEIVIHPYMFIFECIGLDGISVVAFP